MVRVARIYNQSASQQTGTPSLGSRVFEALARLGPRLRVAGNRSGRLKMMLSCSGSVYPGYVALRASALFQPCFSTVEPAAAVSVNHDFCGPDWLRCSWLQKNLAAVSETMLGLSRLTATRSRLLAVLGAGNNLSGPFSFLIINKIRLSASIFCLPIAIRFRYVL